ncbi:MULTISPECIES: hypothetical protein [Streptomyces]|uniref:hypothetical protein n=1 Tax=Streptomyces TaxID=1883 RepID=UPI002A75C94E|nr:hypothetical protein [Streptomyces sp. CL7]WPP31102.1 hypothetical protein SJH97_18035 [Streptomyces sp. CL7]
MRDRRMLGVVEDALREKERELRRQGFEILREAQVSSLLGDKTTVRPDLIARRGDDVVIVEFARRQSNSTLSESVKRSLTELSTIVDSRKNWNFEVVWIGEDAAVPEERAVDSFAHRAVLVAKHDEAAGLLLAYAALEGAIARLVDRTPELRQESKRRPRTGLAELASLGLLSPEDFSRLNAARQVRNSIAHGIDAPVSLSMVQDVAFLAERIADARYVSVDEMVDWFFENYEDPANGVPFDSGEGGYQYVLGGPYDARDVLANQFPDASAEDVDDAVLLIESDGHEWVKKGDY